MNLVQTHKYLFLIMGPHIFEIKLCQLNSPMRAEWSEILFEVHPVFISQKLKKVIEEESLPFSPSYAVDCL